MDEDQITKLGSKMRDVYDDLATDVEPVAAGRGRRRPGRSRNARGPARDARRRGPDGLDAQLSSFVRGRPVAALLMAAGLGYALSFLTRRE